MLHQMKLSRLNINMRDILFNSFKFVEREKSMRERVFIKNTRSQGVLYITPAQVIDSAVLQHPSKMTNNIKKPE